jgi:hypothetical protein
VGGLFDTIGGVSASFLAKRVGSTWVAVPGAPNGAVTALKVPTTLPGGPALVVAGTFTEAGGQTAYGLARWDGTTWTGFGDGVLRGFAIYGDPVLGAVESLAEFDDGPGPALFLSGDIGLVDGVPSQLVGRLGVPVP